MKTIGLITFHHAKNSYGASLQALAMVRALEKMGHTAEIINYENACEQSKYKIRSDSMRDQLLCRLNYAARMYLYDGRKNPYRHSENLDRIYGCVQERKYSAAGQMNDLRYDILLVGSDQVWNPQITGGVDEAFLLRFGSADRRVSYASSMGSHCLSDDEGALFGQALEKFSAVSVRENHARKQLQPLTEKKIEVVADPTLLMTREQWIREFMLHDVPAPCEYILTYFIGGNLNTNWRIVNEYVHEFNLPVWNIQSHSRKGPHADRAIYASTLGEILALISSAALIITDSFHGTAFSVIFQKQFVSVPNPSNPVRVKDLLLSLGLENRIHAGAKDLQTLDYRPIAKRLSALRESSVQWLSEALT